MFNLIKTFKIMKKMWMIAAVACAALMVSCGAAEKKAEEKAAEVTEAAVEGAANIVEAAATGDVAATEAAAAEAAATVVEAAK